MSVNRAVAVWCGLMAAGCGGAIDSGVAPSSTTAETRSALASFNHGNVVPSVVVVTTPRADAHGRIGGPTPLAVTFNTCPSLDGDEGDRLKTTFDFDDDGTVDAAGHCRATHTYTSDSRAVVCVSDRQPGHQICREFVIEIRSLGRSRGDPCRTRVRGIGAELEPNASPGSATGPFTVATEIAARIDAGGDTDWFVFENTCDLPLIVQGRTFGLGGRHDCTAAADARMTLRMETAWGGVAVPIQQGSTCSTPSAVVGLAPGARVWFGVEGTSSEVVPYQLQLLISTDDSWSSGHPLE